MAENAKPIVGYWDMRGRCEPIRLILEYAGVKFEDKRLKIIEGEVLTKEWTDEIRPSLKCDFPNLPYYIEGDLVITESYAIMRYLARKHGLMPTTDREYANCEMIGDLIMDMRIKFPTLCYTPNNYQENKKKFTSSASQTLAKMDKFIGDKKFIVGDKICYVDLLFYETFDALKMYDGELFKEFDNINRLLNTIGDIDSVKNYRSSSRYHEYPVLYWYSHWGYNKEKDTSGNSEPTHPTSTWRYK